MKPIILAFLVAFAINAQTVVEPSIKPGECILVSSTWPPTTGPCNLTVPGTSLNANPGASAITFGQSTSRSAPANEVVLQAIEYGNTYDGKAASIKIFPQHDEVKGFLMAVQSKVRADSAIIEVLYRTKITVDQREVRIFRVKTQVVRLVENMPMLADEVDLNPADVEKINVRLVSESNVVEFWSDTAEIKRK